MAITRDDLTLVSNGQVKFVMARRSGGGVTLPEAIVTLTISV
jgi:HK97 family phage major capsid protein